MEGVVATTLAFLLIMAHTITRSSSSRILQQELYFNVVDYGAVGDGQTDDSRAFMKAWEDFCGAMGDLPTLIVPAGMEFLLYPVSFYGPCNSQNLHIQIQGTIVAPSSISAWGDDRERWILFSTVSSLVVDGGGVIDGRGQIWWETCQDLSCRRPPAVSFNKCDGLQLSDLNHVDSQLNHISLSSSQDVQISRLRITAPDESPNTDGINIATSSNVQIFDSFIGTGDDCIAINAFSSYINISGINCGPGHGISIGSLGKNGAYETVEEVHVQDSNFTRTQNGARIKTWKGGKGYVRKVTFERITLIEARNPIIIDQEYSYRAFAPHDFSSDLEISDILYRDVRGSTIDENAIVFNCGQLQGCTNILAEDVNIFSATPGEILQAVCRNAFGSSKFVNPEISCLSS